MIEFRNKVIHKGYFPTKEETLRFLEVIMETITENYLSLKNSKDNQIQAYKEFLKQELRALAYLQIESKKKYFHDKNPWKLVKRPFCREISTFLSETGELKVRQKTELEKYISELKNMTID